ncbi:hypothetical protein OGAPHI_005079 [Ogataea philodendri]|uniref:Uncharacterized protein n=1 Tax=Ogataea philodendri TaxID=1378263 RepID=A0A9P8T2B7_9ASCO|nr:uncharacterized protein OGAPHI_005079 [Ogataea philodendri]KAH3663678.1 hypothetical protein OGAPHI_005079 [Ogataea philodendri]
MLITGIALIGVLAIGTMETQTLTSSAGNNEWEPKGPRMMPKDTMRLWKEGGYMFVGIGSTSDPGLVGFVRPLSRMVTTREMVHMIPSREMLLSTRSERNENGVSTQNAISLKWVTEISGNNALSESANSTISDTPTPISSIENRHEMNSLPLDPNAL